MLNVVRSLPIAREIIEITKFSLVFLSRTGVDSEHMNELAFGNQVLQERGNNAHIKRMPEIEQFALDNYKAGLREKTAKLNQVNHELNNLKSTYDAKMKGLRSAMKKDRVMIDYINIDAAIILKASIQEQVLYDATKICRELPEAEAMAEDTFIDDRNFLRYNDVLDRGIHVFLAGLDGATGVAQVSGGGTSNDMPWRDKDEDFLQFVHRVMLYAHAKCYPGNRHKRTQNR